MMGLWQNQSEFRHKVQYLNSFKISRPRLICIYSFTNTDVPLLEAIKCGSIVFIHNTNFIFLL